MGYRATTNLFDLLDADVEDTDTSIQKATAAVLQARAAPGAPAAEATNAAAKTEQAKPEKKAPRVIPGDRPATQAPRQQRPARPDAAVEAAVAEKPARREEGAARDKGTRPRREGDSRRERAPRAEGDRAPRAEGDRAPRAEGERRRGPREFDRHSGTGRPITGQEKRGGRGRGNWGAAGDEVTAEVADAKEEVAAETPAAAEGAEGAEAAAADATPKVEEPKEIDFDEYRRQQAALRAAISRPAERIANDGAAIDGTEFRSSKFVELNAARTAATTKPVVKAPVKPADAGITFKFADEQQDRRGPRRDFPRTDRPAGDRAPREPRGDREPREPRGDREPREPRGDREPREHREPRERPAGDRERAPRTDRTDRPAGRGAPRAEPRAEQPRGPAAAPGAPPARKPALDLKSQEAFPALK